MACVVGDGEAETGPLAASWHCNKFLNPVTDGAVLPILHLNGFKIANPTVLARLGPDELRSLLSGYGWRVHLVEGDDPAAVHQLMAGTLDAVVRGDPSDPGGRPVGRPGTAAPLADDRPPHTEGLDGTRRFVDGHKVEGSWRSHQVPLGGVRTDPSHLRQLEEWMRSYRPEELFDEDGRLHDEIARRAPEGDRRMGANPHANGGLLLRDLDLPSFRDYGVEVKTPGTEMDEATRVLGRFLRDVMKRNLAYRNFRVFGPDETASNRLDALFEVTGRTWLGEVDADDDEHLSADGRVLEVLSEHLCEGMLEGYLLTGRHGFFSCYEAFIHIVDSMFNQHAKWLKTAKALDVATARWRRSPTCSPPTCGARTTTASATRTRDSSITSSTRRPT